MIFAAKRRFGGAGGSVVDYVIYKRLGKAKLTNLVLTSYGRDIRIQQWLSYSSIFGLSSISYEMTVQTELSKSKGIDNVIPTQFIRVQH
jgi:hypothetical protein